jgi:hypothetical protein
LNDGLGVRNVGEGIELKIWSIDAKNVPGLHLDFEEVANLLLGID